MLQVARLAPNLLRDSAELVADYVRDQLNGDGGFSNRAGDSDLYYTVFGLECLTAMRLEPPGNRVKPYLRNFGDGDQLDLVQLTCLARCWANVPGNLPEDTTCEKILHRIEAHRSSDGGYHPKAGNEFGTLYGCFLALGAYQDLKRPMPDRALMVRCLDALRTADGGFSNERGQDMGLTPPTAAAVSLMRQLEMPIQPAIGDWLLAQCHPEGGFHATPSAPIPDLLSTATALHALSGMHVPIDPVRERCLDFLDTLWSSRGAFHGNWADDELDCEYTYYGLLALGHLSL